MTQHRYGRRTVLRILGSTLALSSGTALLAACGATNSTTAGPTAASATPAQASAPTAAAAAPTAAPAVGKPVTIQYASWAGTTTEPLHRQAIVDAFMKAHPNIKVTFFYANGGDYMTKMKTLFAAGTAWDVMQVAADSQYPQFNAGLFAPLDSRVSQAKIKKADFFPSMWNSLIWNGKFFAIPLGGASGALAYNKDIFDKAKIPYPTDTMTWDDIAGLCQELTHGSGLQKQFGLAWDMWGEHWEWFNHGYPIKPSGIMTGKSQDYASLLSNEGDPNVTAGREFRWKLMFQLKTLPTNAEMQTFGKATDMGSPAIFIGGHAAMNFDGSWSVATWQKGIKFRWDVARAPAWPNKTRSGWITVNGTGMSAKTKFPDQAWEFTQFFGTTGLTMLAQAVDFYPSKPSLVDAWLKGGGGTPANGKVFSDSMAEGTLKRGSWLDLFAPGWGSTPGMTAIGACFDPSSGKALKDIPAAQQQAEKDINAVIAKTAPQVLKQMKQ